MKHRCGGTLVAGEIQVVFDEGDGISLSYRVPGLVCDQCREELIDRETALKIQASQTPTIVWRGDRDATTRADAMGFDPLTASTLERVA